MSSEKCVVCEKHKLSGEIFCDTCYQRFYNPYDYVVDRIKELPKTRNVSCCGTENEVPILKMYYTCETCGRKYKLWSYGSPAEIQDVVITCGKWLGVFKE